VAEPVSRWCHQAFSAAKERVSTPKTLLLALNFEMTLTAVAWSGLARAPFSPPLKRALSAYAVTVLVLATSWRFLPAPAAFALCRSALRYCEALDVA
jgi:hypothetical protein